MSNKKPQNYEGGHFDIRYSLFDILRFRKSTYKTNSYYFHLCQVCPNVRSKWQS